jgi:tetratricopeptide (TPR) repeat protein
MATIAEALTLATGHHGAGRLQEAMAIYQQVLAVDPRNADALHLLGVAAHQHGEHQQGIDDVRRAIAIQPANPIFHENLGKMYQSMLDEHRARICFGRVLQIRVPKGHAADYMGANPEAPIGAAPTPNTSGPPDARSLYVELMKRCLIGLIYRDNNSLPQYKAAFDLSRRHFGLDWPAHAHTMLGMARMNNIQSCVQDVLARQVPGDLLEAGVWRGGATIFMRALLKAHNITDRCVWVADSFQGVPPPNAVKYPHDAAIHLSDAKALAVSPEQVQENFRRYDLLDDRVRFLKGWFRDTLPTAPIERLAVMRLDGDLYESVMDGLVHLYPKLSPGGYAIIDDFINMPAARQAVLDYRAAHAITDEIKPVDWSAVYWKKSG